MQHNLITELQTNKLKVDKNKQARGASPVEGIQMVQAREQAPKLFPRDLETSIHNLSRINLWMQL